MSDRIIKAWHFMPADRRLRYDDGRKVEPGVWYACEGEPVLCHSGMHASTDMLDALDYAAGPVVSRVELRGGIIKGGDKLVARERRHLWMLDAEPVLRDFARRCALDVVHLWDPPDVVLRYLKTGDEKIRAAARHAARVAAGVAAWHAAGAASDAAWHTAKAAAWHAAKAAAWHTARDAAWHAARDAARDAARSRQSRRLASMLHAARRREEG